MHSPLENDFLHSLTGGLSTWIGLSDVRPDKGMVEDYRWTDNSAVDYRNWNIPDVASDKGKEWHEWDSLDPAPFICKKLSRSQFVGIHANRYLQIPLEITNEHVPESPEICDIASEELLNELRNSEKAFAHELVCLKSF